MASSGENFRRSNPTHVLSETRARRQSLLLRILLTPRHVICGVRIGKETKETSAKLELLQKAGLLCFHIISFITLAKEEMRDVGKVTRTLTDDNSDGYVFNSLLARLGLLIGEVSAWTGEVAATACAPSLDPHGKVETSVPWLPSPISVTVLSFRVFKHVWMCALWACMHTGIGR